MNYKYIPIFLSLTIILFSISACTSRKSNSDIHVNQILDENNQKFIGKKITNTDSPINETLNFEELEENLDKVLKSSNIVQEIDFENLYPSSFVEIEINDSEHNNVPGQLMVNSSISILTKSNQEGWSLKPGETLEYNFEKYKSEGVSKQTLIIGCIRDGILEEGTAIDSLTGTYIYEAKEKGTYYLYLMSASSDYLALKESTLRYYQN